MQIKPHLFTHDGHIDRLEYLWHASKPETIQAQAYGTTTMAGKTFGVSINIEDYSTPAEQSRKS